MAMVMEEAVEETPQDLKDHEIRAAKRKIFQASWCCGVLWYCRMLAEGLGAKGSQTAYIIDSDTFQEMITKERESRYSSNSLQFCMAS